jgi:transcriptional regulator with XRE-family HTH domain
MSEKSVFTSRLELLRNARNLSRPEIAEATGIGKTTLSNWESGHTEPGLANLVKLAQVLGCTIDYLAGTSEYVQPLPPGHWLVDLDSYEAWASGKAHEDPTWAVAIPDRYQIVTSRRFQEMRTNVKHGRRK